MLTTSEMPRGDSYFLQGQQGGVVVTGSPAQAIEGPFRVILAIEDSEVDIVIGDFGPDSGIFDGKGIKAGTSLQLRIDSFFLVGGTVIAYYA